MSGALKGVKTGMPWEKDVRITPLADAARVPALAALIADAVKGGARVINEGGGLVRGSIMSPALVFPVKDKMDLYHEEQFGPIIPVVPFDEIAEPVGYIQSSIYGQQASVFGRGRETVAGFIRSMRTSVARVNVNAKCQRGPEVFPFTGRNDSAHGDFASPAVLEFFSETFAVTHRADPARGRARVKSA
jgi:glyceraldehyde-3-phosphate dehydrogenase (NADP+)